MCADLSSAGDCQAGGEGAVDAALARLVMLATEQETGQYNLLQMYREVRAHPA